MTVTEIVVAGIAAMVVVAAALVLVLSIPDRQGRLAPEPRHARREPAQVPPPPGLVPRPREEQRGPFVPKNTARYAGPPGYGRQPGYGPPPLWGDTPGDRY
jgi:hypothetical protein